MDKDFIKVVFSNSKENHFIKIKNILYHEECSNKMRVRFALIAAEGLEKYYSKEKFPKIYKARKKALSLVADYLLGKEINKEDLKKAADAAIHAAHAADDAANNAAYAAYAAADAAIHAAHAAAYADDVAKEEYFKKLYFNLIDLIVEELNLNKKTVEILFKDKI